MGKISETGIWSLELAKKKHRFDLDLALKIEDIYRPEKMADVGCGAGEYCAFFKAIEWPVVHGYEGTVGVSSLGFYEDIFQVDLTKRRYVGIDYDLVLCLEVGEHIPREFEQVFVDNICEYASRDLVLSWAVPGQGGTGHVNERLNEYVIGEFGRRGFSLDYEKTLELRRASTLRWFKNTLIVFERNGSHGKA